MESTLKTHQSSYHTLEIEIDTEEILIDLTFDLSLKCTLFAILKDIYRVGYYLHVGAVVSTPASKFGRPKFDSLMGSPLFYLLIQFN